MKKSEIEQRLKAAVDAAGGVSVVARNANMHHAKLHKILCVPDELVEFATLADTLNISTDYLLIGCELGKGVWYQKGYLDGEKRGRTAVIDEFKQFVKEWE